MMLTKNLKVLSGLSCGPIGKVVTGTKTSEGPAKVAFSHGFYSSQASIVFIDSMQMSSSIDMQMSCVPWDSIIPLFPSTGKFISALPIAYPLIHVHLNSPLNRG
jgi:hypothetical protein